MNSEKKILQLSKKKSLLRRMNSKCLLVEKVVSTEKSGWEKMRTLIQCVRVTLIHEYWINNKKEEQKILSALRGLH